jgi:Rad3-related DNA helicase
LHPNSRGLIHSVSYPRSELLIKSCQSPRLISHTNNKEAFTEALALAAATLHSVLVSPRAIEGVDLKGTLSEFQVFIKIPFQMLGDPRVKKRKETARAGTDLMVASHAIVQGAGRSIGHHQISAPTYIPRYKLALVVPELTAPHFPGILSASNQADAATRVLERQLPYVV